MNYGYNNTAKPVKNRSVIPFILTSRGEKTESQDKIEAVQRMQDLIESRITERITLHTLAQAAGYSPWHSDRIFKELTGKTPFEYIRALRLSRAAEKLRDNNSRIIDVAFDFVFDSHEGFTKAFSKHFGMSPREYSRNKPNLQLFMPSRAREYYLEGKKREVTMSEQQDVYPVFVQVVDRPARKLILLRGEKAENYFENTF